jgi:hypothetical protein
VRVGSVEARDSGADAAIRARTSLQRPATDAEIAAMITTPATDACFRYIAVASHEGQARVIVGLVVSPMCRSTLRRWEAEVKEPKHFTST